MPGNLETLRKVSVVGERNAMPAAMPFPTARAIAAGRDPDDPEKPGRAGSSRPVAPSG